MNTGKVEALENSDFVIVAVRVGGLRAAKAQIEIPFRYGAVSIAGDSTGPSGILKAITEIPAILDLLVLDSNRLEDNCKHPLKPSLLKRIFH